MFRLLYFIGQLVLSFALLSTLWVMVYSFVRPPVTLTMISNAVAGYGINQKWRSLEDIDSKMADAVIAAEDSNFCNHHGFDFTAIEQAAKHNASGGHIRGGSTISQQTAKNTFLWQNGGYVRKAIEAWFTFLIEHLWSKHRIMEVYLNIAETGIGIYGVEAASQHYFHHDARHLSTLEAARLAAVFPLPKKRTANMPKGFVRRYGNIIQSRMATVEKSGLNRCLFNTIKAKHLAISDSK
ncbi:MAG: monofunctional biosynthetic peptidoglycan transglycosylase [Zymomonas mobilis subsp. pomaceae]|uniref:Biosynthetic peptidoglycan transglycosylase n=1 Tax=Zymomonas mobilis subsp. pomaceae (strain ATCC 29192 / DSM 22645 / JCM 10191 / CCUG 17912 / NBRC 13757 / NCIMB 11200 / NRRL B-4491 / Barker I) TaxID=579138 RepID=F8EUK1_ZYMMT|nr:monofunctional biosynthetic peptidoglycan transglycosylase [Zymomonas mobilis]AEI37217.1 monofunctional biosynthetic peptidoglycan transglycosylase [Zymomonas mobilis subsp. pomaceae ATCC 29192]MDX5948587.1 monofunctional biosynthetic peptidoglycan transglycosylase [Zymomonas mobilis subsp. pomaceae]GEB88393.1 monofunctional biosynthetic peptidoglycan transglycosylase [Zymomonas mobilis subsp. pomaceae]